MSEQTSKITIQESNLAKATKREYGYRLGQFYVFAPISSDDELIDCPTDELQKILVNYVRYLIRRVNSDSLSANTVPKMFRGIRWVLNSNYRENDIKWKPIEALFPKSVKRSGYKAWSTAQIGVMLENTSDIRNKAIIHFQASTGGRVGIHDHPLLVKHLTMMEWHGHGCYAVILYADEDESVDEKDLRDKQDDVQSGDSYWAFLTPESTDCLDRYFEHRKNSGEDLTGNSPIFKADSIRKKSKQIMQLNDKGVNQVIQRIVFDVPELKRNKKGRRYDIQINHGFQKRTNTILKLESEVNSNIAEKILGHKNGLDGTYLAPTRQQCFDEFVKGIVELTIDGTARKQAELESEKSKSNELRQKLDEQRNTVREQVADILNEKLNEMRKIGYLPK